LPPAADRAEAHTRHQGNRAAWNEAAAYYTERFEATLAFLKGGGSSLHPIERTNLGDLRAWCGTAIHLQCASGEDTLSLWVEGARRVVGVDISDVHIANARRLSEALGAPAEWHRCDVLDTPHSLDGTADLVYTGRGALNWLHDLDAWAAVIYRLLKPGGRVLIFEDHPASWLFATDAEGNLIVDAAINYFKFSEATKGWSPTYIGDSAGPVEQQSWKYERLWPIADVFTALGRAGLQVEHFGEHPDKYWDDLPNLKPELEGRIPRTFSMLARRPL
jgi:SAM-dependent methyltransferase